MNNRNAGRVRDNYGFPIFRLNSKGILERGDIVEALKGAHIVSWEPATGGEARAFNYGRYMALTEANNNLAIYLQGIIYGKGGTDAKIPEGGEADNKARDPKSANTEGWEVD